jgi:hypothetical protein
MRVRLAFPNRVWLLWGAFRYSAFGNGRKDGLWVLWMPPIAAIWDV